MSSSDCKSCVVEASSEIRKRCPNNKAAIIWYDNCLFKYSDKDFFGKIDNQNKFYMYNRRSVSDPTAFNQNTKELLSQLAKDAQTDSKLYAVGQMGLDGSTELYGLTQCTRDLSSYECKKCLDGIIGELPSCCDGKQGGRVISGSSEASSYIRQSCPNRKQATVWYDNCSLKYSDEKFFSKIDHGTKFYLWSTQNVTNPTYFNQKAKDLLTHLAHEASVTPKMYAAEA
ncbi:hypothetical protein LWI29_015185 [Acer saccharum]|uniref:Gnk2-homologous domain-containing protein n=1 Tax=Acer saccharum TaxID=4024 RepID=A0AA39SEE8_ACESA|nr:hypothetical protein LWI29_015185 [Acer saccharum]